VRWTGVAVVMLGGYQAWHDAGIVDRTAVVGVRDDHASLFSRQIYGINEALTTIAGKLGKQTGFEPENTEAAGEAQRDGLTESVESAIDVTESVD
jgi:hypothetical protein